MAEQQDWRKQPIGTHDGAWHGLDDGSVVAESGRPVFYSLGRFKREICESESCFACGLPMPDRKSQVFNEEHVIPKWLLRHFDMFNEEFTAPNKARTRYGSYTLRCCKNCNSLLGDSVEHKLSPRLKRGYQSLIDYLRCEGDVARQKLFVWLSLIFVKTHLRDRTIEMDPDPRNNAGRVPERYGYDWETFHHLHAVARSPLTGATIDPSVLGTMLVLQVDTRGSRSPFHYIDDYDHKVMLVRIGDVALVAVLSDSRHVEPYLRMCLHEQSQPYTMRELIELLARAKLRNHHLINRPDYRSESDPRSRTYRIRASDRGPVAFEPPNHDLFSSTRETWLRTWYSLSEEEIDTLWSQSALLLANPPWGSGLPVVIIRHGSDGLPIRTPPCVIGLALNEREAVQHARELGFVLLSDSIAPSIPVTDLSPPYAAFRSTIVLRVFDDPAIVTVRAVAGMYRDEVFPGVPPPSHAVQTDPSRGDH